jgi:hypothetical protein
LGSKRNIENRVVADARFEFSYPKRSTELRILLHRIGRIRGYFRGAGTNCLIVQVLPTGKATGDGVAAGETRDRASALGRKSFSRRGNVGTARGLFVPLRRGAGSCPARIRIRGAAIAPGMTWHQGTDQMIRSNGADPGDPRFALATQVLNGEEFRETYPTIQGARYDRATARPSASRAGRDRCRRMSAGPRPCTFSARVARRFRLSLVFGHPVRSWSGDGHDDRVDERFSQA